MQFSTALIAALSVLGANAAPHKRNSNSWAGSNLFFLQGMSDADQNTYLAKLQSFGAKSIRVWVTSSTAGTCNRGSKIVNTVPELETTKIGTYNDQTLALLDKALAKLPKYGLKALISLHDANLLGGNNGNDIYGQTYGGTNFYLNSTAATQYDARLAHILNYKSPSSGKTWKTWTEAIWGYDLQNEPFTTNVSLCENNDKAGWLCGRATNMRKVMGGSTQQIATGGIGASTCNLMPAAIQCPAVDAIAIHRYEISEPDSQNSWASVSKSWLQTVGSKKVYVEEWAGNNTDQATQWPANANDINNGAVPWMYWDILPPSSCTPTTGLNDPDGIYYNSNVNLAGPIGNAAKTTAAQDWTGIIY